MSVTIQPNTQVEVIDLSSPQVPPPLASSNNSDPIASVVPNPVKPTFSPDKLRLIHAIKQYEQRWAFLSQHDPNELNGMDKEALDVILKEHQYNVSTHNSGKMGRETFIIGAHMVEYIGTRFTPLKLQGLTAVLASNQTVMDTVDELQMKYGSLVNVEPEYRLGYLVLTCVVAVHTKNSQAAVFEQHFNAPVPNEISEKFKDL